MKKLEKYIYLVLVIVLVGVIASGTTYIIMKNNNTNDNNIKDNNKNNENDNKEDNESAEEKITLNDEELEEYLSYIPLSSYSYGLKKSTLETTKDEELVATSAYKLYNIYVNGEKSLIPIKDLDNMIYKMYNKKITYKEAQNEETLSDNEIYNYNYDLCFYAKDKKMNGYSCKDQGELNLVNLLENYEASDKTLIIYTYNASYDATYGNPEIIDLYSGYELKTELLDNEKQTINNVIKHLKAHKGEFTKYKHTFKKNDTGYYWYSTEVV